VCSLIFNFESLRYGFYTKQTLYREYLARKRDKQYFAGILLAKVTFGYHILQYLPRMRVAKSMSVGSEMFYL
jgi:hypothetical protein